jgi:GNAT superfamily N-acetyltransferase
MDAAGAKIHVRRASDLGRYARLRIWLWMARGHQWRTRWASFDWYVTAEIDERLVSAAGIVDRHGAVGGAPARMGLLGGVLTAPEHRRRGLAGDVVRRSTELIANELQCDFGVLMCGPELIPFYERLGWRHVSAHLEFVRFGKPGSYGGPIMVFECAGRSLPAGPIDVMGLPA